MILLDSMYINNSGGFHLLDYMVKELTAKNVSFYLLADSRCQSKFDDYTNVEYSKASMMNRRRFYLSHQNDFTSILCFGNIPTPIRLNVPVYTYFHNINLLTLSETHSVKNKVTSWLKREVFKHYKKNTNYWLVQTSNTGKELINHLKESKERVKLMPFYEITENLERLKNEKHGDDYVYVSNYTRAKGHEELLEAWKLLHRRGINQTLHLTIPLTERFFCQKIEEARQEGVKVVNHGFVPFEKVLELYKHSKAIVYPSHNESLGLGIIEAITAGCDVIGADLPYIHAICKPSCVFDPYTPESIAESVIKYEVSKTEKSKLIIYNHINELIGLLTENTKGNV